jgi:hypothetical protein
MMMMNTVARVVVILLDPAMSNLLFNGFFLIKEVERRNEKIRNEPGVPSFAT